MNITCIETARQAQYMNPFMLNEFRELLTKMREEANGTQSMEVPEYQTMPDEIDVAAMQEMVTMEMRRRERDAMLLKKINKSLTKIENNDYGYCTDCGGEIGADRLRARPTADLCISCKETAELIEHRFSKKRAA